MPDKIKDYTTEHITVTYSAKRCIHAAKCVAGLPQVFDVQKRPWIQPEQAEADAVAEVVMQCPTGALQFTRHDGGPAEPVPTENTIQVKANGPLHLHGDLTISDSQGNPLHHDTRISLCRCGDSQNKPFCDNTHKKANFEASGQLGENSLGSGAETEKLILTVLPNGPVLLTGSVIIQGEAEQTFQGSKGALCRCGASQNKPFCDGNHTQIGFTAD